MNKTQHVFVVGSGRCGTKMIKSLLAGVPTIEARHEYVRNAYQREAALWYMGKMSYDQIRYRLWDIYHPAALYSEAEIFLDSSHKLSWVVDVLKDIFPEAKFIHLVRDGRKVVESFFYKLNIFDDRSERILRDWVTRKAQTPPPIEEKFWHPLAPDGYDMFQRICHHWVISNENILRCLKDVPHERKLFVRLEDLAGSPFVMKSFLDFLNVPFDDSFMAAMQKPKHVYVPVDYKLTDEQLAQFRDIAADMMSKLGYDMESEVYSVKYQL